MTERLYGVAVTNHDEPPEGPKFSKDALVVVNPRIVKASADLTKRLLALADEPDEIVLTARIVVRNGIPRKVKWQREEEETFP